LHPASNYGCSPLQNRQGDPLRWHTHRAKHDDCQDNQRRSPSTLKPSRARVTVQLKAWDPVVVALLLVSASGLAFEIALTRLFSLLFQYHYAFLALSVAVLGLSLGAVVGQFLVSARPPAANEKLPLMALLALSVAFPLVSFFLARFPSGTSVLPSALVALVPFLLIGLFAALTFAHFSMYSGLLYCADLLGAAMGMVVILGLLTLLSAFDAVIFLGVIAALAGFVHSLSHPERRRLLVTLLAAGFGAGLLGLNLFSAPIAFTPARLNDAPRDKTMMRVLRDPSRLARIVYTAWNPFARVDVVETADADEKFVFTDGGAGSFMYRFNGDLEQVASLRDSPEFLPFTLGPVEQALVLGAGAGKDMLLALLAKVRFITAVEVNPAMVRATRHFADFNGNILDRPQVRLVVGDARTFVQRTSSRYDLIYLNLVYTQAAEPANQALVENFVFTLQAFQAYLDHLNPGGHLAIVSHNALEGSRAAITGLQALSNDGKPLPEALRHLALLMVPANDPTQRLSVMVLGKEPLQEDEIRHLAAEARHLGLQPLFLSGLFEAPFAPLLRGRCLDEFVAADPTYDLSPTNDDHPFFFKLDPGLPPPVERALLVAAVLAAILLVLTLWRLGRARRSNGRARTMAIVLYAAILGMGFMLVEVPLVQRFQLLLGHPILSVALVLGALLLAGGLGSLFSQRWAKEHILRRVTGAALLIAVLAGLYWLILPSLVQHLLPVSLSWRVLATAGLTALLGLPMGIPFPSVLRLAGQRYSLRVPLVWGVNGAFSVLGSTLAMVISMMWGFGWAMVAGAMVYLALAMLVWRWQT
jgi:hypothetical protein